MGCQRYQYIREKYPDMLENDAAMMKIVEHCYPYLREDQRRKAEMERFLQEFRTEAEGLLDSGFMRKVPAAETKQRTVQRAFSAEKRPRGEIKTRDK